MTQSFILEGLSPPVAFLFFEVFHEVLLLVREVLKGAPENHLGSKQHP